MNKRPSWHRYFMEVAILASKRSTCLSRQVGAIAIKNNRIIATGYNGQIPGAKHCTECLRKSSASGNALDRCRAIHAEQNIVCQAGFKLIGSTIYTILKPCNICFKLLAGAFVENIIYTGDYPDPIVDELIKESNYHIINFEEDKEKYFVITNNIDYWLFKKYDSWKPIKILNTI